MNREFLFVILLILFSSTVTSADWSPGSDEIAPSKDTFLSLYGALAEPFDNFGGAESLYVGGSLYGHCVTIIQFDLSGYREFETLKFVSDITAWGASTRTIYFNIISDKDWEELEITASNNELGAYDIIGLTEEEANYTLVVTGSTEEVEISLTNHVNQTGKINLLISGDIFDDSTWITLSSKENSYLSVFSNPPRIVFKEVPLITSVSADPTTTSVSSGNGADIGSSIGLVFVGLVIVGIIVIYNYRSGKKKKAIMMAYLSKNINQQTQSLKPNNCTNCGTLKIINSKFCNNCGQKF